MTSDTINNAEVYGIESVPAAVVFAIVYAPLLGWFTFQAFRRPTYALIVLSLFCASESSSISLHV
jgi:hypothetical protein